MIEVNDEYESGEDDNFGLSERKYGPKKSQQKTRFVRELASRALSLRAREISQSSNCFQEVHLLLDLGPAAEEARETARALAGVLVLGKLGHRLLPIYLPALRQDLLDACHALAHGRLALRIL